MSTVTVLVGNPKPTSRTRNLAVKLAGLLVPDTEPTVIDLADHARSIFDWPSAEMDELTKQLAGSDLLVVASPTYKASYSGLLKAFLDRYNAGALAAVQAVPVLTGGDWKHYLAVDTHLRPLLVELGASVPTAGLYFPISDLNRSDEILAEWAHTNAPLLRTARPLK